MKHSVSIKLETTYIYSRKEKGTDDEGIFFFLCIVTEKGEEVTAEALSVFYKDFLNKAYGRQMEYNRTWWKMNIAQLYPGFKAAIRSLKSKNDTTVSQVKGNGFWEKSFES